MGTRYGRRDRDGTTEYYDSKEELVAAADREVLAHMANFFTVGLLAGGATAYYFLHHSGAMAWPKLARAFVVVGAAVGSAVMLRAIGRYLLLLAGMLLLAGLLVTVGRWLWHLA